MEDESEVRSLLSRLLRITGYTVDEAESAEQASQRIEENTPDLVLLDT